MLYYIVDLDAGQTSSSSAASANQQVRVSRILPAMFRKGAGRVMKSISAKGKFVVAFAFMLGLSAVAAQQCQAQTFSLVYTFTGGNDGGRPLDGFIADSSGNLYATSFYGGAYGNGVVFKITSTGTEQVLYSFAGGTDGANPEGGLLLDSSSNLYGTTTAGGKSGAGTIFEITSGGEEIILHSFTGGKDGSAPEGALVMDSSGSLYGTTTAGGTYGNGTAFKLTLSPKTGKWGKAVLHSFGESTDGTVPVAGVALDKSGNVYGTASAGGIYGYGTIFELVKASDWKEINLHEFQDGDDGAVPYASLIADSSGNFYGAATEGGSGGGGVVFKLSPSGKAWTFKEIYSNPGWGISGSFRALTIDSSGNLYGTTHCDGEYSSGTVYELSPSGPSWNFTSLYNFTGGSDGQYSFSNPVLLNNTLYGTTNIGGANGVGVVWQVTL
jgi:uncharacterized repeat protein (TIGR03803 family)